MNDYRETQRANAEYGCFTGTLVRTITTTHYDPTLKAWIKRTVEYIDVGRPHHVQPADADKQLAREPMWHERREAQKKGGGSKQNAMRQRVIEYINAYGTATARELATELEIPYPTMTSHLLSSEGAFYARVGKAATLSRPAAIWGLVGVHDKGAI